MPNTPTHLHPVFDNIFKTNFPVLYETLEETTMAKGKTLVLGRQYHVEGWKAGTTFKLERLMSNDLVELRTPKTHKKYVVNADKLVNIARHGRDTKPQSVVKPTTDSAKPEQELQCYGCGEYYLPSDVRAYAHASGAC